MHIFKALLSHYYADYYYEMIQKDHAYRFLKNVRGSSAYFQRVMYDVLALYSDNM